MARRKRAFIVKLPPQAMEDFDKFMERLSKAIAGDPVLMKFKDGYLRIEVYGGEVLARRAKEGIKKVLQEFKAEPKRGTLRVTRQSIYREAGVAIPLDVLEIVLRLQGYDTRTEGDEVYTSAPSGTIFDAARLIAEYLREAGNLYATRTAKRLVIAAGALTGASILEIIDAGLESGVLEEDDEGKLLVPGDWREAVKKLVKHLAGEG